MGVLYQNISFLTSRLVTNAYSTSFSIGIRYFHPSIRSAIYSIYVFVRFADKIVDTFQGCDKEQLLLEYEQEYYKALRNGISMNPVIHSFQHVVNRYKIDDELVQNFFNSMKSDLHQNKFEENEIKEYIHGSAEVIGLICLKVFVYGNNKEYEHLKPYAIQLSAAFQKINFLHDLKYDTTNLHRIYFPVLKDHQLDEPAKHSILEDIYEDYRITLEGIKQLSDCSRLGVYTTYLYYLSLAKYIESTPVEQLLNTHIRVSNRKKMLLLGQAYLTTKFK